MLRWFQAPPPKEIRFLDMFEDHGRTLCAGAPVSATRTITGTLGHGPASLALKAVG